MIAWLKRSYYAFKIGGIKFLIYKIHDGISHHQSDKSAEFLYHKLENASTSDYEKLIVNLFGLHTGIKIDLSNPQTFNEKLQWLKIYHATDEKTRLSDKLQVRDWVKEKIGEKYLVPLLGTWTKGQEIPFEELPEKFVLKANHGCGWNIIVKDKSKLDFCEAQKQVNEWLNKNFAWCMGLELHYYKIPPCVLAEQFIDNNGEPLTDYKVHCFDGNPSFVQVIEGRDQGQSNIAEGYYDFDGNRIHLEHNYHMAATINLEKDNLKKLYKLAEILAVGFPYVRVDFYKVDKDNWKFSEMTFTPASGYGVWKPEEMNILLGQKINLPQKVTWHK